MHVCLITPGHVASTPRIVKEAEALVDAGYRVTLISSAHYPPAEPFDRVILDRATWRSVRVRAHAGPATFVRRFWRWWLRRRRLSPEAMTLRRALTLLHPGLPTLVQAAVNERADFYHGHCVAGLAVAAQAAQLRGVPYGFDAEDFHEAETEDLERNATQRAVVKRILQAWLPGCRLRTAAAPLIAEEYRRCYATPMEVVLNAFPLREAPPAPPPMRPTSTASPARLYWFSQTIGPGRGLEGVISAMGFMKTPTALHLRGGVSASYANTLRCRARQVGLPEAPSFLPPANPDEMARLASEHDLGLSVEQSTPRNHDLCLANKVFVYLLAGIPQLLSRTAGQSAIAPELGEAALLMDLAEPARVAAELDAFFASAERVAASRRRAWELGRSRYCWEVEGKKFVGLMTAAFSSR